MEDNLETSREEVSHTSCLLLLFPHLCPSPLTTKRGGYKSLHQQSSTKLR